MSSPATDKNCPSHPADAYPPPPLPHDDAASAAPSSPYASAPQNQLSPGACTVPPSAFAPAPLDAIPFSLLASPPPPSESPQELLSAPSRSDAAPVNASFENQSQNLLPKLRQQLSSLIKSHREEACDTLAHIAAGSPSQLAALIASDIIPPVVKLLQGDEIEVKLRAAQVIRSVARSLDAAHVEHLVQCGCLAPLVALLGDNDDTSQVVLEAIECILKIGQGDLDQMGSNMYLAPLVKTGVSAAIETILKGNLPASSATLARRIFDVYIPVPKIDFATEWVCEYKRVWPKAVDYCRQCPKGHPLASSPSLSRGCHVCGDVSCGSCGMSCSKGCTYGVCVSCVSTLEQPHALPAAVGGSSDFPTLGVSPAFLRAMKAQWGETYKGWTTEQTCQQLWKSLTCRSRGSMCSDLQAQGSSNVGVANLFLSHTWSSLFSDTVDAVLALVEGQAQAAWDDTFIWFDMFSTSQHTVIDRPSSWWMGVFKSSIEKMGQLAMVLQPWDDPAALKRAWCVLELYSCASTGGRFHVAMPPAERKRYLEQGTEPGAFKMMLSRVNSKEATCSSESDRVSACVLLVMMSFKAS